MFLAESTWHDMFYLNLPILEKILRPIIVYVFLIVGVRLAGKRQLAQLNAFDLVVLLTLSNTVQNAIIGDDNSVTGGIVGAATLLLMNYFVVWFLYDHEKLDHLIEGDADVLVEGGKVKPDRLRRELITQAELEAAARGKDLAHSRISTAPSWNRAATFPSLPANPNPTKCGTANC